MEKLETPMGAQVETSSGGGWSKIAILVIVIILIAGAAFVAYNYVLNVPGDGTGLQMGEEEWNSVPDAHVAEEKPPKPPE